MEEVKEGQIKDVFLRYSWWGVYGLDLRSRRNREIKGVSQVVDLSSEMQGSVIYEDGMRTKWDCLGLHSRACGNPNSRSGWMQECSAVSSGVFIQDKWPFRFNKTKIQERRQCGSQTTGELDPNRTEAETSHSRCTKSLARRTPLNNGLLFKLHCVLITVYKTCMWQGHIF